MIGQQKQVRLSFPQWWHENLKDVEPVVQVCAERPVRNHLVDISMGGGDQTEVAVCRRDDADVDRDGGATADPFELPLLQDPEQLDLCGRIDIADLIEEERAPLRRLEAAFSPGARPGEGTLLVP